MWRKKYYYFILNFILFVFHHSTIMKPDPLSGTLNFDRSSKSEISRFFTYIEVLNLLRGSVSVYKTYKPEFISACVQYRK